MTSISRPKVSQSLMKTMKKHSLVKVTLEKTGLTLKTILQDYCLIVPSISTRESWMVIGPTFGPNGDLIEKTLKLAWSYTNVDPKSDLYLAVCDEVSAYDIAMELLIRREQSIKASKLPRPKIPAADLFIENLLNKNLRTTKEFIWKSLPESQDDHDLYKDGEILYCASLPRKQLTQRAFGIRVEKIRKRLST